MSTTNPTNITTQWEDLQVKHGNLEPREKPITNEELTSIAIDFAEQVDPLEHKSLKELDEIEDEVEEDVLFRYRQQRLQELKRKAAEYKFGELLHLHKDQYTAEVSKASEVSWVVVHLYKESVETCVLLNRQLQVIAKKFGEVKFMKAISTDVIENFPDKNLPTVLLYKDGVCKQQLVGGLFWGGKKVTPNKVEWVLSEYGIVETELEDDPRDERSKLRRGCGVRREEEVDESDDDRGYSSLKIGPKMYRQQ